MSREAEQSLPVEALHGRMVHGFFRVLGAESLVLPAGIVVVGVLARRLDTSGFARFSLAFAIVSLAELFVVSLLAGSANKAVSTSSDWRPVGDAVLGIYLAVAGATGLILIALAHGIALSLHLPALEPDLRFFALDLLPFGLARAHRDILSGTGRFAQRANSAAVGTLVRMVLTVAFVLASPTVSSAIAGTIGGSVAELVYCRRHVRPRLSAWKGVFGFTRQSYLGPVFVASVAELVLARIDLVVLRWLGAPNDQVSLYGAAQRLSLVVGLYGVAIAGPLLATLGILMREGKRPAAANLARLGVRFGLLVLPFVALVTATATELATLVLGVQYAAAGPLLAILITAAFARIMVVVGNVLLLGADRPRLAAWLAIIAVGGAFVAYWILIPQYGGRGAAAVTLGASLAFAIGANVGAMIAWHTRFPIATLVRSLLLGAAMILLARLWPATGSLLVLKLILLAAVVPLGFYLLGEWKRQDIEAGRMLLLGGWSRPIGAREPE